MKFNKKVIVGSALVLHGAFFLDKLYNLMSIPTASRDYRYGNENGPIDNHKHLFLESDIYYATLLGTSTITGLLIIAEGIKECLGNNHDHSHDHTD